MALATKTRKENGSTCTQVLDKISYRGLILFLGKPISFINWRRNRPNNKDGAEHYAFMISNGQWEDVEEGRTVSGAICVRPFVPKEYQLPDMIEEWVWTSVDGVDKSETDNFYVQMASSG